jgi:hypothetical protein
MKNRELYSELVKFVSYIYGEEYNIAAIILGRGDAGTPLSLISATKLVEDYIRSEHISFNEWLSRE